MPAYQRDAANQFVRDDAYITKGDAVYLLATNHKALGEQLARIGAETYKDGPAILIPLYRIHELVEGYMRKSLGVRGDDHFLREMIESYNEPGERNQARYAWWVEAREIWEAREFHSLDHREEATPKPTRQRAWWWQ